MPAIPKMLKTLGMGGEVEYELFDKFINVELEEYLDEEGLEERLLDKYNDMQGGRRIVNLLMQDLDKREDLIKENAQHFTILTTNKGCKPYIGLQAEFLPGNRCTKVTVTIHNLESEVNINTFSVCRVNAGYYNGLQRSFMGFIINSYIESANPNGNTVFQFFDGGFVGELITPRERYIEMSGKVGWVEALQKAAEASGFGFANDISQDKAAGASKSMHDLYNEIPAFGVGRFTKRFKSGNDIMNWFNRIGKKVFYDYGLEPPRIVVENGVIRLTVTGQEVWEGGDLPIMNYIKTARYIGGAVEIKAPWNPMIMPMRGFICDPKYFRGRLNAQAVNQANHLINLIKGGDDTKNLSPGVDSEGKYCAITVNINFDTRNTNEMTITGVSLTQMQDSEGLTKAIDVSNKFGYGEGYKLETVEQTEEEEDEITETQVEVWDETVTTESSLTDNSLWAYYTFQQGDEGYKLFGSNTRSYITEGNTRYIFKGFWEVMMEFADLNASDDKKELWMQKDIPGQRTYPNERGYPYDGYKQLLEAEINKSNNTGYHTEIWVGTKVRFPLKWKEYLKLDGSNIQARTLKSAGELSRHGIVIPCPDKLITVTTRTSRLVTVGIRTPKRMLPPPKEINGKSVFSEVITSYFDTLKGVIGGGEVLTFKYGYIADSEGKLQKLRDPTNKAFNRISDYFDLAPAVLYFKYKDFKAEALRTSFKDRIDAIRLDPDFPVPEFALSVAGLACLQIIAQRDWYEKNAEKDDAKAYSQLMGFSKKFPSNNASFNKPKMLVETEMNIAFPNWEQCLVNNADIAQYFMDIAEWCEWNSQYRLYHDMLQIDALNIRRIPE